MSTKFDGRWVIVQERGMEDMLAFQGHGNAMTKKDEIRLKAIKDPEQKVIINIKTTGTKRSYTRHIG